MHGLLIPAKSSDDSPYFVLKNNLEQLIRERKIQQFRRSNGWLAVDEDQRKRDEGGYGLRRCTVTGEGDVWYVNGASLVSGATLHSVDPGWAIVGKQNLA